MKFLSKKIIKLVVFLAIFIYALEFSTNYFNFNQYKPVIQSALSEKLKVKVELKGDIKYSFIPLPHLELKKIKFLNSDNKILFKASSLDLYSGFITTPSKIKSFNVDKLGVNNGVFNFTYLREHFNTNNIDQNIPIKTIVIKNSGLEIFDPNKQNTKKQWIDKLNAKVKLGSLFSKNLTMDADFEIQHQQFNFEADLGNLNLKGSSDSSSVAFYNDAISINFDGKLANLFSAPKLSGKISSQITNLDKFALYFGDSQYLKEILNKENIHVTGNLEATPENLNLTNVNVNSTNIDSAIADVSVDFHHGVEASVNIKVGKINLDNILASTKDDTSLFSKVELISQKLLNAFDFEISDDINSFLNLEIKSIVLNNENISDIMLNLDTFSSNASLNNFEFTLPGSGRFQLKGVVTHNQIRPKFIGELILVSKEFPSILKWLEIDPANKQLYTFQNLLLKSEVSLIPHSLRLINTKSSLGKLLFVSSSNVREGSDGKVNFATRVRFNKINSDDFGINKILDEFIAKLYISDSDKTGETHAKLTNDYQWLRKVNSNLRLDLISDKFIFKNNAYDDFNLTIGANKNELRLDRIAAKSELARFNGSMSLSLPSFRPYIDVDFNFDFLDTKFFDQILPPKNTLKNSLIAYLQSADEINKAKANEEEPQQTQTSHAISDFNFYSAHSYDGAIKLDISNLVHNNFSFENVHSSAILSGGVIFLNKLNADLFGGTTSIKANVTVISAIPNYTASYAFYNVNPGNFTEFFSGQNKMSGYMSVSGAFSTSGSNASSFVSKMQGDAEVLAKKVTYKGFDLGELVNIPEIQTNVSDKLKRVDYYTKYGESIFDKIKGKIVITNGIASFDNFILENNRASGVFAAKYDLYNKTINSISKINFIPIGQVDSIELKFTDKGLLSNPTVSTDMSKLIEYITYKSQRENRSAITQQQAPTDKSSILRKRVR